MTAAPVCDLHLCMAEEAVHRTTADQPDVVGVISDSGSSVNWIAKETWDGVKYKD